VLQGRIPPAQTVSNDMNKCLKSLCDLPQAAGHVAAEGKQFNPEKLHK